VLGRLRQHESPLDEQLESILAYYAPILRETYTEDYPKRETDLEHLTGVASRFADRASLLDSLALDPIELSAVNVEKEEKDEPPLVLSTIHSAKGLEFKSVFVIQSLDGVLPSSYSVGDAEAMDEELRLLYVAITRAEDQLFLSYPMVQFRRYEGQYFTKPSRFLEGLPDTILEPCTLVEAPRDAVPDDGSSRLQDGLPGPSRTLEAPNQPSHDASDSLDDLPF